uniref:Nuclear receptor domain-containing protein n=1 Tax=Acrobeloides nanus TaxID=290746 RepID=A0A914CGX0_9BILA
MDISKEKNCLICGVPTSCLHYDVFSCRGCKQFFRRSYLFAKQYKCKFKNDCNLKKDAKCKACRYKKCIAVGMNPEAIVSNETTAIQTISTQDDFHMIPELLLLENRLKELRLSDYKPTLSKNKWQRRCRFFKNWMSMIKLNY